MTINSFYNGIMSNLFLGGVAGVILLAAMFWKANKVAESGNKAKMAQWSMAPALMVIAAVMTHGIASAIVIPRLQQMFQSVPMQNTVALGDALTQAADGLLFGGGGEGGAVVGPAAFTAAQPTNNAGAVTFADQPAPAPAAQQEPVVSTNEQAVAAVNNLAASQDDAMTYINTFVADNTSSDPTVACGGAYTIKPGDSLAKIAKACYGDSKKWRLICQANSLRDCNNVRAGVALVIPGGENMALVQAQIPATFGQPQIYQQHQSAAPVYAEQPAQQAAAPVRNLANGQVVINTNADAVAAVQALAPVQPQPTPVAVRAVTTYAELKQEQQQAQSGESADAYIARFIKEQNNQQVASAGN